LEWDDNIIILLLMANHKVFGVDLDTLVQRQKSEVPKVVLQTIEYLHNKKAHLEEGIFRIPGNNIKITQLKKLYDSGSNVDLYKHSDLDVHTVACLLKMFLRELPVPVIIPRYYSTYLKVYQNPDPKQRLINFRKLVMGLPKSHRTLLMTTMEYLHLVAANQSVNKMSTLNLALIFAPNLMRAERETLTSIMEDADKVAGTLQALIQEVEFFVTGKQPHWFSAVGGAPLSRTKSVSSPPNPLRREDSISILLSNADADALVHNNDTNSTTNTIASETVDPTLSSSAPVIYKSLLLGESTIIAEAAVYETQAPTVVYETQSPSILQSTPPLNISVLKSESATEDQPTLNVGNSHEEAEDTRASEGIPLAASVLCALTDLSELISKVPAAAPAEESDNSTPTSPRIAEGSHRSEPTTPRKSRKTKSEKNNKRRELQTPPEPRSEARQNLTTSGESSSSSAPKRRIRSLSSYVRSSSDTSLSLEDLKEPDEKLIAKSVKNMKALRASCDFDKPRRRLSILSERIARNQAFSSHQQLKSFMVIDEDR
jgi:hypothetical protein